MPATTPQSKSPLWENLLEEFRELTGKRSVAEVARELNREYLPVWQWIKGKKKPNGESVLAIVRWCLSNSTPRGRDRLINKLEKPANKTQS